MHKTTFIYVLQDGSLGMSEKYPDGPRPLLVIRVEVGSDGKPLNANIVPKNGDFEPTFTLRASDAMAQHYVRHWAEMADMLDVDKEKVISAKAIAGAMSHWSGKVPD